MTAILLAGRDEAALMRMAYPALISAGLDVAAIVTRPDKLGQATAGTLLVIEADLFGSIEEAVDALSALPARLVAVLPLWWEGEKERLAASLPAEWVAIERPLDEASLPRALGLPTETGRDKSPAPGRKEKGCRGRLIKCYLDEIRKD